MLDEAQIRREKLLALQRAGVAPYASTTARTHTIAEVLTAFEELESCGDGRTLAGRILTTRLHGALAFADLADASGKIQLIFKEEGLGEAFARFRDTIDPGDILEARGVLMTTKRGERSLDVRAWNILSKALLPLPEKWHGLQDIEKRYREREMDILTNPEVKQRFFVRSKLVASLRRFLDERGFLEVETPMLQTIPGGANAQPFVTHHNALDIDLYLRIATELHLKRLVVGGFEKVYEIGRCFRNEGIDYAHNPEFTMLELYWAYADTERFMAFLEELLTTSILSSVGTLAITQESGEVIDFSAPFPRITFRDAIERACGVDIDTLPSEADVKAAVAAKQISVDFAGCHGRGECLDELYKKTARKQIIQPTWVFDYPAELKPLSAVHPIDPTKSASCQLVVMGAEVVNAYYHELTDPIAQRAHLEAQQALREQGSDVAQRVDEEFLRALEHGMPPTSGVGFGIDRLVALLTGAPSLKEVILFPTLRPEQPQQ